MKILSPRTGRPKSDNPKCINTRIRMTVEDAKRLDDCCKKTGMTKTDVIMLGIDMVYKEMNKQK